LLQREILPFLLIFCALVATTLLADALLHGLAKAGRPPGFAGEAADV
jgi:hypothetical protein